MTSTSNLADVVRHYQRSIERHGEDETRLLHCITKLFNLPITFEHLQETGIGKTVNALRKINGEVGVAAKTLVTKWKAMVAAEEEPTGPSDNNNEADSQRSNGRRSSDEDQDQENKGSNSSGGEDKSKHESRRPKSSEHKSKSSSSKSHSKSSRSDSDKRHKSSSSDDKTGSMSKEHRKDHKSSSRKSKDSLSSTPAKSSNHRSSNHSNHSSDNSTSKQKHHSSSSSSHKSDHSKSKHEKIKEDKSQQHHNNEAKPMAKEKTDKHKSNSTSSSSSSSKRARTPQRLDDDSPQAKKPKSKPKTDAVEQKETPDGFDSSMGANFDDVLGMLNMPISGKKNALKLKSPNKPTTAATTTTTVSTGSATKRTTTTTTTTTSSSSSRMTSTRKPELLASSAKLEPLDPSIALELPTISNNYKPMPLNQTVMDVVFNHGLGSSAHKTTRINESEALAAGISSKTMRTKIYSGVRTGQILQVPSLFDLCIRVLQKNIDALEYTGGVPFEVLRPVLERATPQQLLNFEEYNPYLMEDSDVLWQQHVHRHCRSQHREEMETWREMFLRCEEEKARKLSVIAESIKASQKISEAPVRKTQLAFVDSMVKPPRSVQRKQEQYGTNRKLIATPAARVAALSNVTPNAAKVGDARLRVLNSARDAAQVSAAPMRNKKAPLMAKALQLIRGRQRR
ncbi:hypothetical protein ACLKA7_011496 [Drosophila subpalustris]